jgi:hypothetical protein
MAQSIANPTDRHLPIIFALYIVPLLLGGVASDRAVLVDGQHGQDTASCGKPAQPCKSIGWAIMLVGSSLARINVHPGSYRCSGEWGAHFNVTSPLIIAGTSSVDGHNPVVIDCAQSGAAFQVRNTSSFTMANVMLRSAQSVNGGGIAAVGWQATSIRIVNCSFVDCTADKLGGALYVTNTRPVQLTVKDSSFVRCDAAAGGAVGLFFDQGGTPDTVFSFNRVKFIENHAAAGCGAVCTRTGLFGSPVVATRTTYIFLDCVLTGNYAPQAGALGINHHGSSISNIYRIINCKFTRGDGAGAALQLTHNLELSPPASFSGIMANCSITMSGCLFTDFAKSRYPYPNNIALFSA